jgi:hypothetical protein
MQRPNSLGQIKPRDGPRLQNPLERSSLPDDFRRVMVLKPDVHPCQHRRHQAEGQEAKPIRHGQPPLPGDNAQQDHRQHRNGAFAEHSENEGEQAQAVPQPTARSAAGTVRRHFGRFAPDKGQDRSQEKYQRQQVLALGDPSDRFDVNWVDREDERSQKGPG